MNKNIIYGIYIIYIPNTLAKNPITIQLANGWPFPQQIFKFISKL